MSTKLLKRIEKVVEEQIRPFINMDGGEIEIIELTPEKVLKIKLSGACDGCPAASYTLDYGIQQVLIEEFPEDDVQVLLVPNE